MYKAVVIHQFGGPEVLRLENRSIDPPGKHEVQVRIEAAALNPKDIMVRKGKFKFFTGSKFPMQLGYDFAGTIEISNGHQHLPEGLSVFGMLNSWKAGAYAQKVNVPIDELFPMPKNVKFEEAAGIPLVALTALQAIRDNGKLKPGQHVLINGGSGGVGTAAIQIAKAMNAEVTSVSSRRNFELCQSLGADHCIDYNETPIAQIDKQFDLFFDVFGNQSFAPSRKLLKPYGRFVGTIPNFKLIRQQFASLVLSQKASLVVVKSKRKDLGQIAHWIDSGLFRPVVDQVFPIQEVKQAHEYLQTKRARGKVILSLNSIHSK